MRIRLKHETFKSTPDRRRFAKLLSCIIEGEDSPEVPYRPNQGDDAYWTLDLGNDWKVLFDDELDIFRITYRYQCRGNQYEEALAGWLKVRLPGCEILDKS